MKAKIKRIIPPKFKVGRYVLNEYELRSLMLEVCEGKRDSGIKVVDMQSLEIAYINTDGSLTRSLQGLRVAAELTIRLIRERNTIVRDEIY